MFCLSGLGSHLTCQVFPPYDVSDGDYVIGLVDLATYNSIPNVEEGINDKFYYGDSLEDLKEITISEGAYEIEDLEQYIRQRMSEGENGNNVVEFSLQANNNTLKSELFCKQYSISFEKDNTIGPLLGFNRRLLKANELHVSDSAVKIIKVETIRVDCNIARGSFENGVESHVIHEFYHDSAPGYKIVETPTT